MDDDYRRIFTRSLFVAIRAFKRFFGSEPVYFGEKERILSAGIKKTEVVVWDEAGNICFLEKGVYPNPAATGYSEGFSGALFYRAGKHKVPDWALRLSGKIEMIKKINEE